MNLDEFISDVTPSRCRPNGHGGYLASCPCANHGQGHGDRHQSLSIDAADNGGVLLYCHAGCSTEDVAGAFGLTMRDLMGRDPTPAVSAIQRREVATYNYADEGGEILYQVVRYSPKGFAQRRPDGRDGWTWKLGDTRRVLYRLPEVTAAVRSGHPVVICEGEKDVDALIATGAVATCNPHGAGKWRPEYSEYLRGADVTIIRDRDEPGRRHAEAVAAALTPIASRVRIVEAACGKDAADHLAAGNGLDDFLEVTPQQLLAERQETTLGVDATEAPSQWGPLVLEAAHAEVLTDLWLGKYRWAAHERTWRRWTGRYWKKIDESVAVNAAQKALRSHYGRLLAKGQAPAEDKRLRDLHKSICRHGDVQRGLAFLKGEPGFHTEFEEWDADPYDVNCADGILNMRTQTLRPHDPSALCTKITKWAFKGDESSGAWQAHLQRCIPEVDVRRQVQRDLGRALVGAALEESLPIWYGVGANGKTTTARAILMGIDGYGRQAVKDLLVAKKFERHSTELADLAGSRLVVAEEIQDGRRLDEATVKMLTGGNRQKARFMRADNFEFEQTFSITLLVNHPPIVTGSDTGIWRRLRLIPWTVSIPPAERRPQDEMVAELVADGAWMLRWMVAGFADWQANHYWRAEAVDAATAAYQEDQDMLAGFLGRCCVVNPNATATVEAVYGAYVADSSEHADDGTQPLSKIALGRRLKSRNITQYKGTGGVRFWRGIGLVAGSGEKSG